MNNTISSKNLPNNARPVKKLSQKENENTENSVLRLLTWREMFFNAYGCRIFSIHLQKSKEESNGLIPAEN